MTMTLTEFLLARYAEDEAAVDVWSRSYAHAWSGASPATWQPARILAECWTKRLIVKEHTNPHGYGYCPTCYDWETAEPKSGECPTLRALALPYADDEQFQEEWRV